MKVASSASRRTTSSASPRMRAQTGSTLSSAFTAFVCSLAITNLRTSILILAQRALVMEDIWAPLRSWPHCQKRQHAALEHLVAHRLHVVATGNIEWLARRQQRRKLVRGTGHLIGGTDRHQRRHPYRSGFRAAQRLTRAPDACGQRLEIGPRLLGESTK